MYIWYIFNLFKKTKSHKPTKNHFEKYKKKGNVEISKKEFVASFDLLTIRPRKFLPRYASTSNVRNCCTLIWFWLKLGEITRMPRALQLWYRGHEIDSGFCGRFWSFFFFLLENSGNREKKIFSLIQIGMNKLTGGDI